MDEDNEFEGGMLLFPMGAFVVVHTDDMGTMAGGFIGLTEFGIAFKMTHREGDVKREVSESQVRAIHEELNSMTVKELSVLAREANTSVAGRKADIVARIAEAMVKDIEETMPEVGTIELAVPTTTLLSWSQITMIQDGNDYLNNQEVIEFRDTIADGLDIPQVEATVPPVHDEPSGE